MHCDAPFFTPDNLYTRHTETETYPAASTQQLQLTKSTKSTREAAREDARIA